MNKLTISIFIRLLVVLALTTMIGIAVMQQPSLLNTSYGWGMVILVLGSATVLAGTMIADAVKKIV